MIAYIFPGQGSQFAGMGKELAAASPAAANVLEAIDGALGFCLSGIMFGEDPGALLPTDIQQPAVFAHSVAALAAVWERHEAGPAMVAGHSLGEYSALVAAGCMSVADAARLVRTRGELMARAAEETGGAMAAVVSMEREAVEAAVRDAADAGVVVIANYNCPGQIVISGEADAVARARDLVKERGGRAIPLKVSGAFHSPLMAPAAEALRPTVLAADLHDAQVPLVSNVDATPRQDALEIKQALIAQVTGAVRWEESIRRMIAEGVTTFLELGPGTVLSKMIPRIDDGVAAFSAGTVAQAEAALAAIG